MALNASGPISLGGSTAGQSIALELGLSATGQISLNDAAVRTLAGVASGAIVMPTDFWGKSNEPIGSLYSWGVGSNGVIGNNTDGLDYSEPALTLGGTTWRDVWPGANGIKEDNTLWYWGPTYNGTSGANIFNVNKSSPVQVGALTNWKYVGGNIPEEYNKSAIKTDGTLWTWGYNTNGDLGQNNRTALSSPVQVGALTTWGAVSRGMGLGGIFFITTDNKLYASGLNANGQLGLNNAISRSSPVQVGSLANWKQVAVSSGDFGRVKVAAIKTDGTLWAWGQEAWQFNVGTDSDGNYSSPVQVGALTNWKAVSQTPVNQILLVKSDGTLWAMGRNTVGQLGDGTTINRSSPVQIGALTDWSYAEVSSGNGVAVRSNGTLWNWGNTPTVGVTRRSSPVQVDALTTWERCWGGGFNGGPAGAIR